MFVLVVSPGFSLVQTMMTDRQTDDNRVTNPLVEASLRDGLIIVDEIIQGRNWHKIEKNQVSAPLILDPVAGSMISEMKLICKKFENLTGMRVPIQTRAGKANKQFAKSEPLKKKKCEREDCFPCTTRG